MYYVTRILYILLLVVAIAVVVDREDLFAENNAGSEIYSLKELFSDSVLDLKTAREIALRDNPGIDASEMRVKRAAAITKQAMSTLYPRIDLTASYANVNLSDHAAMEAEMMATLFDPSKRIENPEDYYQAGLTVSWMLFNGFERKFSILSARAGEESSKEALMDAKRLLLSSVTKAYYSAQLSRENIKISEADMRFNERLIKEARARRRAGTGSMTDELNFQIKANIAKSQFVRAKKAYEISKLALAAVLGLPDANLPENIGISGLTPDRFDENVKDEVDHLIQYALKNRPDILSIQKKIDQASAAVRMAQGKYYPSLNLSASIEGERSENSRFEEDDFGNTIYLSLSYNLFSGKYHSNKVKEAKAIEKEALHALESIKIQVVSEIKIAFTELQKSHEQLAIHRSNALLARKYRNMVEKKYAVGSGSLVMLNAAQLDLTAAQNRLAQSLVAVKQARYNLLTATGKTTEPAVVR